MGRAVEAMSDPQAAARMFLVVIDDLYGYFGQINADRKQTQRDDRSRVIAQATIDGKPIADTDARTCPVLVTNAGHDTTSASAAGAI